MLKPWELHIKGLELHIEGLESHIKTIEAALRLIASCDKRADGDVVDIARRALSQEETTNA